MERRAFLHTGLVATALSAGSGAALPRGVTAKSIRANGPVRLNANENPLGPSPSARQAIIDGIADSNRYPFTGVPPLLERLAAKHKVAAENVVVGTGSTEILQMTVQAFGRFGSKFVIADPTFEDVPGYAVPWDLDTVKVPLRSDWAHDIDAMKRSAAKTIGPVVVYICNPNNPTATLTPSVEVDAWIRSAPENIYFLVDEAYYEFAQHATEYSSAIKWIHTNPRVVVARTFSKIYGMAGMRLGYALAHPMTASLLRSMACDNGANHLAIVAAMASLDDDAHVARSIDTNERSRRILHGVLDDLDLEYLPSYTNFLMHRINGDLPEYITRMADAGFNVGRPFPPMLEYNRVSFGSPEQMEEFGGVLRTFRERGWV